MILRSHIIWISGFTLEELYSLFEMVLEVLVCLGIVMTTMMFLRGDALVEPLPTIPIAALAYIVITSIASS
jgi:hypothetical protein